MEALEKQKANRKWFIKKYVSFYPTQQNIWIAAYRSFKSPDGVTRGQLVILRIPKGSAKD